MLKDEKKYQTPNSKLFLVFYSDGDPDSDFQNDADPDIKSCYQQIRFYPNIQHPTSASANVPEFIDPVFAKTSPKTLFSVIL
jgi:hypothetical protein